MSSDPRARQVGGLFFVASALIVLVLISVAVGAWFLLGKRVPRTQLESDLAAAQTALQAKPQDPFVHEEMSKVYARMDRQSSAIDEMKEAVRLAPKNPRMHANLALIYSRYGMHKEAIAAAKETIEMYERAEPAHFVMGTSYYALGDLTQAQKALERAVELEPTDADARFALGNVFLDLGKKDDAGAQFLVVKSVIVDYPGIDDALAEAGVEASGTVQ